MSEQLSPRVNSKRLAQFVGKTVRLPCKVVQFNGANVIVEASDGGQVSITLSSSAEILDTFAEVIGTVTNASTIKMMACINMGDKLDLKLTNDVIELTFDPRHRKNFLD